MITFDQAQLIEKGGINAVEVFSPLTCKNKNGICAKCYGIDLSNGRKVAMGTPVGVIAAQSIGEPGTQLTLQTKHSGGVVGVDVTQGLPRVEELFEARIPKVVSPIAEISGKVKITEGVNGWEVGVIEVNKKQPEERQYRVSSSLKLAVENGQLIEAGCVLANGSLDIRELLVVKGLKEAQKYLINQVQLVYESQGIPINDKHFEVIVRKMSDGVKIMTSGDTLFLPGEIVSLLSFGAENERIIASGGEPATACQVILGISKRSLHTDSWLSAASFEMTTDVLTESSLRSSVDTLLGLKENVIIGRLIPVVL
jgi:DNA-directed RNA polymerase subunit beta'